MGLPGIVLCVAVAVGVGFMIYQLYTQPNTPYGETRYDRSEFSLTLPDPDDNKKRRKPEKKETEKCSICLDSLSNNVKKLPCGHSFHDLCVGDWFKHNKSCPNCRKSL